MYRWWYAVGLMQGWIGTDSFGKVERLGKESVQTEFFCVVLPLWPLRSYYEHHTSDGTSTTEIRLHPTSVALGYLRVVTWMAALMLGVAALADYPRWGGLLAPALGLTAVASVLTFALGRLSSGERKRRELLRRVVGTGAPPELLPSSTRDTIRDSLEARWYADHHVKWADAIAASQGSELLVALAEYHLRPVLAEHARACLDADDQELN